MYFKTWRENVFIFLLRSSVPCVCAFSLCAMTNHFCDIRKPLWYGPRVRSWRWHVSVLIYLQQVRNMVVGMTRNAKRAYEKKLEERRVTAGYPPCFSYHQRRTSSSSYRSTSSSYRSSSSLRSSFTSGSSNSSVCAN